MAKKRKNYSRTFLKKNVTAQDKAHRFIYVIKCANGYWYVGQTKHPSYRYMHHEAGTGSWFTKIHKPLKMTKIIHLGVVTQKQAEMAEDEMTMVYIQRHGVDKVRGGKYIQKDKINFIDMVYENILPEAKELTPRKRKPKDLWSDWDVAKAKKELNRSGKFRFGNYVPVK